MKTSHPATRRAFLKTTAAATPFISRLSWADGSPMQKLQYAAIGVGGRGGFDIGSMTGHKQVRMVAAADVDATAIKKIRAKFEEVKTFSDWRVMLQSMDKGIDVVTVSTPDHMHGIQAMSAMNLGKHAYIQKPLAQNIGECRGIQEAAQRNKVLVQMGTQGASSLTDRMATDLIRKNVIGKVSEVWAFCGKGWGDTKPVPDRQDPVPEGLDWDGWLGVAAERPYLEKYYHPKTWRRRQDLGSGGLGDMGCHIFNSVYRGLALTAPRRVRSSTKVPNEQNWATGEHVEYEFPGTPYTEDTVKVFWVSGKNRAPKELTALIPEGVKYRFGCLLKGSEGVLLTRHGSSPWILPRDKFAHVRPAKLKALGGHHHSFIETILDGNRDRLMSPVDFAAPMTEFILLGNIAMQHSPEWLEWNAQKAMVTNNNAANARIHRTYRRGWQILGI